MTYFEQREKREKEAREQERERRRSARERELEELQDGIDQAETQWEEYSPERVRGNTSMGAQRKRLETLLDDMYERRKRLQEESD